MPRRSSRRPRERGSSRPTKADTREKRGDNDTPPLHSIWTGRHSRDSRYIHLCFPSLWPRPLWRIELPALKPQTSVSRSNAGRVLCNAALPILNTTSNLNADRPNQTRDTTAFR